MLRQHWSGNLPAWLGYELTLNLAACLHSMFTTLEWNG